MTLISVSGDLYMKINLATKSSSSVNSIDSRALLMSLHKLIMRSTLGSSSTITVPVAKLKMVERKKLEKKTIKVM